MSDSLRKRLARSKVEERKSRRRNWSPKAWAAAVKSYQENGPPPQKRFPIVVGAVSMAKTPESLKELLGLPSVSPVIRTSKVIFEELEDNTSEGPATDVDICPVTMSQFVQFKKRTEGESISILFDGKRRSAWCPKSLKENIKA
jgi:hypothetical protein